MSNFFTSTAGWRRRACTPILAGAAALTVGAIAFAPSAGAAGLSPLVKPAAGSSSSAYLGGYQATPSGGLASASTTFTMPKLTCTTAQDNEGAAILFGVYTDNLDVYAFATGQCTDGGHVVHVQLLHAGWRIRRAGCRGARRRRRRLALRVGIGRPGRDSRSDQGHALAVGHSGQPGRHRGRHRDLQRRPQAGSRWRTSPRSRSRTPPSTVTTSGSTAPTRFNALNGGDTLGQDECPEDDGRRVDLHGAVQEEFVDDLVVDSRAFPSDPDR